MVSLGGIKALPAAGPPLGSIRGPGLERLAGTVHSLASVPTIVRGGEPWQVLWFVKVPRSPVVRTLCRIARMDFVMSFYQKPIKSCGRVRLAESPQHRCLYSEKILNRASCQDVHDSKLGIRAEFGR